MPVRLRYFPIQYFGYHHCTRYLRRQIKVVCKEIRWEAMESISAAQDKDKEWAFVKVIMNL